MPPLRHGGGMFRLALPFLLAVPALAQSPPAALPEAPGTLTAAGSRAAENAVRQAGDAFGTTIGQEEIGLYSSDDVRGFSPQAAGNVRMPGSISIRYSSRRTGSVDPRRSASARRYSAARSRRRPASSILACASPATRRRRASSSGSTVSAAGRSRPILPCRCRTGSASASAAPPISTIRAMVPAIITMKAR